MPRKIRPLIVAVLLAATACGLPSAPSRVPKDLADRSANVTLPLSPSTTSTVPTTTTTTLPAEQPGWIPAGYSGSHIAIDLRTFSFADSADITVARFRAGQTHFDLHVGSSDPPANLALLPAEAQPMVSAAEAPLLLGAFNGGFKTSAGAGGVQVDGETLLPLVDGLASFVIDKNGTGHVGVWGQDLPLPAEQVWSVRQNLVPLLSDAQPSPQVGSVAAWGATLGGGSLVARSALGEDAEGNILYAGSMSALPIDLANALIESGATTAMELDINPEWVQLALALRPGAPLVVGVPGQNRAADQVTVGWTRDFITVLGAT